MANLWEKKSQLSIFVSPASLDWLMAKNISNDHERLPKNYWIISSKTISTACFQETDNNDISNHADWRWELDTEKQGLKDIKYGPSHVSQSSSLYCGPFRRQFGFMCCTLYTILHIWGASRRHLVHIWERSSIPETKVSQQCGRLPHIDNLRHYF